MRLDRATAFLFALKPRGIRFGLENTRLVLEQLGRPDRRLRVVHVAGSNGKGSTCAFLDAALHAAGYRCGLYTSPHLVHFRERFRMDGRHADDAAIEHAMDRFLRDGLQVDPAELEDWMEREKLVQRMRPGTWYQERGAASRFTRLTFFECTTVLALLLFAEAGMEVAVMETGMGGRLDATNVLQPVVSAITPIQLEHTEWLGKTISAIAGEKAGIIKAGVPVVCARQVEEAAGVLQRQADTVGAPLRLMDRDFFADGCWRSVSFRDRDRQIGPLRLPLPGDHQVVNAATAFACLNRLEEAGWRIPNTAVTEGLTRANWPGRMEGFGSGGEWILDGAHNPDGAEAVARTLRDLRGPRKVRLVFGVLKEKQAERMLPVLLPLAEDLHLVRPADSRGRDPNELLPLLDRPAAIHDSVEAALERLRSRPGPTVVVTGSLTVVGEARAWLQGQGLSPCSSNILDLKKTNS